MAEEKMNQEELNVEESNETKGEVVDRWTELMFGRRKPQPDNENNEE
ncbi:hypothetical protein ACLIA0_12410 [Bacillaceae bacterium W0354]